MAVPSRTILVPAALHSAINAKTREGESGLRDLSNEDIAAIQVARDWMACDTEVVVDGLHMFQFPRPTAGAFVAWVKENHPEYLSEVLNPSWISEVLTGTLFSLRKQEGYPVIHTSVNFAMIMKIIREAQRALLFFGWDPTTKLSERQREVISRVYLQDAGLEAENFAMALAITDPDPFARNDSGYSIAFT